MTKFGLRIIIEHGQHNSNDLLIAYFCKAILLFTLLEKYSQVQVTSHQIFDYLIYSDSQVEI